MEVTCKYSDWTRGQVNLLLNILGEENARNLLARTVSLKFGPAGQNKNTEAVSKFSDWTEGQVEALLNVIGEDNAKNILSGTVSFVIESFEGNLFDKNGRRIPKNLEFGVCDSIRLIVKPEELLINNERDYQVLIDEFNRPLGGAIQITGQEFGSETERLFNLIAKDQQISKILKGSWMPVILPKWDRDVKSALGHYLRAVRFLYTRHSRIKPEDRGNFCGNVYVSPESRYDEAIAKMRVKDSVGIYFPSPLLGYSVLASREQMATLPKGFVLAGLEPLIAAAMYPRVFSNQNIHLDLAAFSWVLDPRKGDYSQTIFNTKDASLALGLHLSLNHGQGNRSSGLLFIG